MKNIYLSHLKVLFLALFLCLLPAITQAEYIESFDSEIVVSADSSFEVSESIEYVFESQKHGIFRNIPTTHPVLAKHFYENRIINIEVSAVLMDGLPVKYELENRSNEVYLKIGNPDKTITGNHLYQINYKVIGGISYTDSGEADLYWNVTGNDWIVPIKNTSAKILSSDQIFLDQRSCYRGFAGSNQTCDSAVDDAGVITFNTNYLSSNEGMTVSQAINPALISKVELIQYKWIFIVIPLFFLGILYGAFSLYKYEVKYKTGRTIIAEYEPYPGVKPMYSGLLFDNRLDPRDITAGIVYLAEQGYLKIRNTETKVLFFFEVDDYEVTLLKELGSEVSSFERKILELIFGPVPIVGDAVLLSKLKNSLTKRKENEKILISLKKELKADLVASGFFEQNLFAGKSLLNNLKASFFVVTALILSIFLLGPLAILLIGVIIFAVVVLERRRTRKGYEALDHLKGFKLFLEMTDKERFKFHNAPKKSPEQFMEYLPYAIAFGVEKQWAEVFKDITIGNPDWYEGGSGTAFSATSLATSVNSFSTALASASVTPSSSSSGGGHSGGGGGGGGGGSW